MTGALAAAIDVATELAWYPIANGTRRNSWYLRRREAHAELCRRLTRARLPHHPEPQLVALLAAMRRVAAATFCNRCGPPYYARRTAVLQLRGCLDQYREAAA
jgi:hypothetical protein